MAFYYSNQLDPVHERDPTEALADISFIPTEFSLDILDKRPLFTFLSFCYQDSDRNGRLELYMQ